MEKTHLSLTLGAVLGVSAAATGLVLAADSYSERSSETTGMQPGSSMESDSQAAGEQSQSLMQMQVGDIKGKPLASPDGTNLGEISDIVQSKDDRSLHAVIAVGGMLGVSQNRVAYPLEDLQLRDDEIVTLVQLTEEDLDQRTAYNADDYESVSDTQRLAEVSGMGPTPGAEIASFEEIDQNADGFISREEAQQHASIVNAWQDVDINSDDQLDEAEFSAFEAGWEAASPSSQQQPDTGMDSDREDETGMTGGQSRPNQP